MRIDIFALAALLALGCAHKPAPTPIVDIPDQHYYVPGDERLPVRSAADLVGHYRSVLNDEELTIYVDAGELMMRSSHQGQAHRMAIRTDGGVGVNASVGGGLVRRHGRLMLHILWCYRWGLYETDPTKKGAPPGLPLLATPTHSDRLNQGPLAAIGGRYMR